MGALVTLRMVTDPPGVEISTEGGYPCTTPCELKLPPSGGNVQILRQGAVVGVGRIELSDGQYRFSPGTAQALVREAGIRLHQPVDVSKEKTRYAR